MPISEVGSNIGGGTAAASATQFGRYARDLRSTNGMIQCNGPLDSAGRCTNPAQVIETYGGIISFNTKKCWYLDSSFCAPLHKLKANMGSDSAAMMIQGIAFGVFALAALICVMLILRVMSHQHCCNHKGEKGHRTFKKKLRASAEEMSHFGVLPTTALLLCLWTPISLQNAILKPCWSCFDFEAAAVHEIGHILGLNHPDAIAPLAACPGTGAPCPNGSNVHSTLTAANDGMIPHDAVGNPLTGNPTDDACLNPWKYVTNGTYPLADDANADTGVRMSIMYSLTEHNPKVCLTPDDIEAINTIYPRCDGRSLTASTATELNCYKTKLYIGAVRVLVYIFIPILALVVMQLLVLSCLKHHHDQLVEELHSTAQEAHKQKEKHKRKSLELEARAVQIQDALQSQIATEEQRVEERAQEMAAQMIQARLRGKMARQQTAAKMVASQSAGPGELVRKMSSSAV